MGGEVKIGLLQVKRKRRPFPAGRDRKVILRNDTLIWLTLRADQNERENGG